MEILPLKFKEYDGNSLTAIDSGYHTYNVWKSRDSDWIAYYVRDGSHKICSTKELAIKWCNENNEKRFKKNY